MAHKTILLEERDLPMKSVTVVGVELNHCFKTIDQKFSSAKEYEFSIEKSKNIKIR